MTVFRLFFAFFLTIVFCSSSQASEIVQMTYVLKSSEAPVTVLEDRKFVICDACPPYAKLLQIVPVVKPAIVMRFRQPRAEVTKLEIPAPKKECKEPLEVTVYFPFDEFKLKGGESAKLDAAVDSLKVADKIEIRGYTCRIGSKKYNDNLARKRASEVASYLMLGGISKEKMEVSGTGKCCYKDNARLDVNRRVEVKGIKE
jgi:outer membrane protein OmpA-like peptidoglycan-associated protein